MSDMSRFAGLLMFLSWLLYGAMPATASLPAANPMQHSVHAGCSQAPDAMHENHAAVEGGTAGHDRAIPCPHGGESCMTTLCAACLTVLPQTPLPARAPSPVAMRVAAESPELSPTDPVPLERPPNR